MTNPFSSLFAPSTTLARIKSRPRWFGMFALLALVSIIIYVLTHPFLVTATLAHLPSSATQNEKEAIAQTLRNELALRCFFLPVRLLIGWSSCAAVLFFICKSFAPTEPIRFVNVFALEVHAELVNILARAASLIRLLSANTESTNETSLVPFSAAALIETKDIVSFSLLNSLNFFTLLYVVILIVGISTLSGLSRTKSLLVVVLTWSAYMLFNVGTLKWIRDTMHLLA